MRHLCLYSGWDTHFLHRALRLSAGLQIPAAVTPGGHNDGSDHGVSATQEDDLVKDLSEGRVLERKGERKIEPSSIC